MMKSSVPSFKRRDNSSGEAEIKRTSLLSLAPSMTLRSTQSPRGLLLWLLKKARGGRLRGMPISRRSPPKAADVCNVAHKKNRTDKTSFQRSPADKQIFVLLCKARSSSVSAKHNNCFSKRSILLLLFVAQEETTDKPCICAVFRSIIKKTHGISHSFLS